METTLIRFPTVGKKIFNQLDDKDLVKCKKIDKIFNIFLDKENLFSRRIIQKYTKNQIEHKEYWNLVTKKAASDTLTSLAIALEAFFKFNSEKLVFQFLPHEIVVDLGMIELYKYIYEQTKVINPVLDDRGWTPFHSAAKDGNLEIIKYISGYLKDKNPGNDLGHTPLSVAAKEGHFEYCL